LETDFIRYYDGMVSWCRKRVRPHLGDPEEFVHRAYLRCRRRWSQPRRSPEHVAAYFYRALRWVVIDELRRNLRRRVRQLEREAETSSATASPIDSLSIQEAIDQLTARERAICRGFLAGKTEADLERELRLSPGAVAVHACRAQAKLRRLLLSSASDPERSRCKQ
jgi:RNA polymerase sigma factor (sigma-70 family)